MKVFWNGFIAGMLSAGILFGFISGLVYFHNRDRRAIEYAEKNMEIFQEELYLQNLVNRDPVEFLDDIPGVRGAADGATIEFNRRVEEILQRFRNRSVD